MNTRHRENRSSIVGIVLAVAAGVGVLVDAVPAVRLPLVLVLILFLPGWAILRIFRLGHLGWPIAVALSIAIGVTVSEVMIYTSSWTPASAALILAGVILVIELFGIWRSTASSRMEEAE
jgi:uncharacterized membrane protein